MDLVLIQFMKSANGCEANEREPIKAMEEITDFKDKLSVFDKHS